MHPVLRMRSFTRHPVKNEPIKTFRNILFRCFSLTDHNFFQTESNSTQSGLPRQLLHMLCYLSLSLSLCLTHTQRAERQTVDHANPYLTSLIITVISLTSSCSISTLVCPLSSLAAAAAATAVSLSL